MTDIEKLEKRADELKKELEETLAKIRETRDAQLDGETYLSRDGKSLYDVKEYTPHGRLTVNHIYLEADHAAGLVHNHCIYGCTADALLDNAAPISEKAYAEILGSWQVLGNVVSKKLGEVRTMQKDQYELAISMALKVKEEDR